MTPLEKKSLVGSPQLITPQIPYVQSTWNGTILCFLSSGNVDFALETRRSCFLCVHRL